MSVVRRHSGQPSQDGGRVTGKSPWQPDRRPTVTQQHEGNHPPASDHRCVEGQCEIGKVRGGGSIEYKMCNQNVFI